MAAVIYARCGACGLTCAQRPEGKLALGPEARLPIVCTVCGARRDYVTRATPDEERKAQAEARAQAEAQADRHAEIARMQEAHLREIQEAWVLLGAELQGLGPVPQAPDA